MGKGIGCKWAGLIFIGFMSKVSNKPRKTSANVIVIDGVQIRLAPPPKGRASLKLSQVRSAVKAVKEERIAKLKK